MRLLREAARMGNLEVIKEVIQRLRNLKRTFDFLDTVDGDGVTPLHVAIMNGHVECVKELLKVGCSPEILCNGTPVLQLALIYSNLPHLRDNMMAIVDYLCRFGAPLTMKDNEGRTVFHMMAKSGVSESVVDACIVLETLREGTLIQSNGCTPDLKLRDYLLIQKDIVGETALHVAARHGNVVSLQKMFQNCTSSLIPSLINATNEVGNTPLHLTAVHNQIQTATVLIKAHPGCLLIKNKAGKTALELAQEHGYQDFARFFIGHCEEMMVSSSGSQQCFSPTWILTSKAFKKHKTAPDGVDIKALPPENNRRWSVLADRNLGILRTNEFQNLQWKLDLLPAKLADILKVHSFLYFAQIKSKCLGLENDNSEIFQLDGDTAISHGTFHCALLAAGAVCQAIDLLMNNQAKNAFCVVRPPGHHAGYRGIVPNSNAVTGSNGFCIFNNVAIGAAYAMDVYRHQGVKKVAILDFDVHHGNGTEECVKNTAEHQEQESHVLLEGGEIVHVKKACAPWLDDNDWQNILFASVQGYGRQASEEDGGWFYPGSGDTKDTGFRDDSDPIMFSEDDEQTNPHSTLNQESYFMSGLSPRIITVGISGPGSEVESWKQSWRDKILPEVVRFDPDLILISAGFDAHKRDDINGGFVALETHHYEWLTQKLVEVANKCCFGRMVSVLEGGYAVQGGMSSAFANSVASHVRALNSNSRREWDTKREEVRLLETKFGAKPGTLFSVGGGVASNESSERSSQKRIQEASNIQRKAETSQVKDDTEATMELVNGCSVGHQLQEMGPSRSKRRRANVDYVALNKVLDEEERGVGASGT